MLAPPPPSTHFLTGDARTLLPRFPPNSINCCVTSPPYFGLRDYGIANQIGLEQTPQAYIDELVLVFREVRRVLRDDGTLWLNLGDSYANDSKWGGQTTGKHAKSLHGKTPLVRAKRSLGLKSKDLIGIPWRVAFALQQDGWYLRQDIIWHKPNPMPESVRDRCTKAHEYIFMFSKSPKYYFDHVAIQEPFAASSIARLAQPNLENQAGSNRVPGKTNGPMKACGPASYKGSTFTRGKTAAVKPTVGQGERVEVEGRNRRSVWTVTTKPFKEAHFATFPPDLIEPCILAGCPPNGLVLDPFGGAGTTALVSRNNGRRSIAIELNPDYVDIARRRLETS